MEIDPCLRRIPRFARPLRGAGGGRAIETEKSLERRRTERCGASMGSVLHWFGASMGSVLHWFGASVGSVLHSFGASMGPFAWSI